MSQGPSSDAPTLNLADAGRFAAHDRRFAVDSEVDKHVVGEEATRKACGVRMAMLLGTYLDAGQGSPPA